MLKLIGLSLILAASGAVGAGLAGTVRRQQAQALAQTRGLSLSSAAWGTILSLFDSLGRYDLEGSVQALDLALSRLREEAKALQNSAAARCRTYLTLGVCTGLAAAVILI